MIKSEDPEFIEHWAKQLMGNEAFVNFLCLQSVDLREAFLEKIAPYYNTQPADSEQNADGENTAADEIAPVTTEASTAEELYDVLMACDTYEQIEAILRGLTEEQQKLMDEFTDEQNADLEAKMTELGAYGISTLEAEAFTGTIKSVEITDTIETNGQLNLVVKDTNGTEVSAASLIVAGYTIEWKKGTDTVTRTQVMYGKYTMAEDKQWVNVVYDKGAQKTYTVAISKGSQTIATKDYKVDYNDALVNGSFEEPKMTQSQNQDSKYSFNAINYFDQQKVTGWRTTASDGLIEIGNVKLYQSTKQFLWSDEKKTFGTQASYSCSTAVDRDQIAELNATQVGALYQDVLTEPGAQMNWALSHRGRGESGELMALVIAPYSDVKNITTQAQLTAYIREHEKDDNVKVVRSKKDARVWETYSGEWNIPEGQYLTRFFFVSLEAGTDGGSYGNLLDNVWFSTEPVPPTEGKGQLTVTKEFYGLDGMTLEQVQTAVSKDFLTYTASGSSETVTPDLKWGVGSGCYTASFSITPKLEGADTITYTVTEDTSKAQIPGYTLTSTGTDTATDNKITKIATVSSGETETLTFTNTYTPSTVDLEITKIVRGNMVDETTAEFEFEYSYEGMPEGETNTFTLKGGKKHTIEGLPIGTVVTITEKTTGYNTSWTYTTATTDEETGEETTQTHTDNGNSCTFTVQADEYNKIECINVRDIDPDTGISLDSLPYILMLTFAGAAGIFLALRKRHNYDI